MPDYEVQMVAMRKVLVRDADDEDDAIESAQRHTTNGDWEFDEAEAKVTSIDPRTKLTIIDASE